MKNSLLPLYEGPFEIVERPRNNLYRLRSVETGKTEARLCHVEWLLPWYRYVAKPGQAAKKTDLVDSQEAKKTEPVDSREATKGVGEPQETSKDLEADWSDDEEPEPNGLTEAEREILRRRRKWRKTTRTASSAGTRAWWKIRGTWYVSSKRISLRTLCHEFGVERLGVTERGEKGKPAEP